MLEDAIVDLAETVSCKVVVKYVTGIENRMNHREIIVSRRSITSNYELLTFLPDI